MKKITYKENTIIDFGDGTFQAFVIIDGDAQSQSFPTLEKAKMYIDRCSVDATCDLY